MLSLCGCYLLTYTIWYFRLLPLSLFRENPKHIAVAASCQSGPPLDLFPLTHSHSLRVGQSFEQQAVCVSDANSCINPTPIFQLKHQLPPFYRICAGMRQRHPRSRTDIAVRVENVRCETPTPSGRHLEIHIWLRSWNFRCHCWLQSGISRVFLAIYLATVQGWRAMDRLLMFYLSSFSKLFNLTTKLFWSEYNTTFLVQELMCFQNYRNWGALVRPLCGIEILLTFNIRNMCIHIFLSPCILQVFYCHRLFYWSSLI